MSEKYVISTMPLKQFANAKVESASLYCHYVDDLLSDFFISVKEDRSKIGQIMVARVEDIVPRISAVFFRINPDEKAYLPMDEVSNLIYCKQQRPNKITVGDLCLVQITKEPIKTKDTTVSSILTLKGRYVLVSTNKSEHGFSKKLKKDKKQSLQPLTKTLIEAFPTVGMIFRTECEEADDEIIESEACVLAHKLTEMIQKAPHFVQFSICHQSRSDAEDFLMDCHYRSDIDILTDDQEIYASCLKYLKEINCNPMALQLYQDDYPLYKLYSLETRLSELTGKTVWLKSGANIVIEQTEAMTVIDVNSGKNTKNTEDYHFVINEEAAKEISRQIRLRNLSGIIVVDFIDMKTEEEKAQLVQKMKSFVKDDPAKTNVIDLTPLGLMEITRKKIKQSLNQSIFNQKNS